MTEHVGDCPRAKLGVPGAVIRLPATWRSGDPIPCGCGSDGTGLKEVILVDETRVGTEGVEFVFPNVSRVLRCVLAEGLEKYPDEPWRHMPPVEHWEHFRAHIDKYLAGDKSEDHIGHALCRLIMYVERLEARD